MASTDKEKRQPDTGSIALQGHGGDFPKQLAGYRKMRVQKLGK